MSEMPLARLQVLLRDLFQYDYADLDFGIYRLFRLKRGEVETFLTEQLPRRVDEVFMAMVPPTLCSLPGRGEAAASSRNSAVGMNGFFQAQESYSADR